MVVGTILNAVAVSKVSLGVLDGQVSSSVVGNKMTIGAVAPIVFCFIYIYRGGDISDLFRKGNMCITNLFRF